MNKAAVRRLMQANAENPILTSVCRIALGLSLEIQADGIRRWVSLSCKKDRETVLGWLKKDTRRHLEGTNGNNAEAINQVWEALTSEGQSN
ncbi:MAG: hypothetical protein JW816_01650 [Candidatus Buchananbacteria bacterium]|nr:hypothetical protein [Candidatus Buchananbacteria bacterium]